MLAGERVEAEDNEEDEREARARAKRDAFEELQHSRTQANLAGSGMFVSLILSAASKSAADKGCSREFRHTTDM